MIKKCKWVQRKATFKQRYYDHKNSFIHEIYQHKTSLSNYVGEVKNKFGIDPILKWEIVKRCSKYKQGRYCKLWMEEKDIVNMHGEKN